MSPNLSPRTLFRRLRRDQRGGIAVITGISTASIIGMAALVVDLGNVMNAHRQLQTATDAAALAGAKDINCCSTGGTALTTATSYSATPGNRNANANLNVSMASGYPQLKCFTSTGMTCGGVDSANGIVVKQNATVPLFFGPVIGINSVNISATSTAAANGGAPSSLDVMIVLDTTASMNNGDSSCTVPGISHPTREDCAVYGVRQLLMGLWPTLDQVGLMVFPGVSSSTVSREYDCSTSQPTIVAYKSSPVYKIISLSTDYRASNTSTGLNTSSNLVKAARGGASGCTQGLSAVGGVGTYFADVITAAQTDLTTNGRTGVQKVIILLSDGDAGASSTNMTSSKYSNQCHQAITAAQTATAAGTWVYSIAYGASTSSSGSCGTDSPHISACSTMQQIASNSSRFYSDTSGTSSTTTCPSTNSVSSLSDIFTHIGTTVTGARLMPDNTM